MLTHWLGDMPLADFYREHFQQTPLAKPSAAREAIPLLTWDLVAQLVASRPRPDTMVVRNGKLLEGSEPSSVDEAQELFGSGCSIVMRRLERHDAGLASLAKAIGAEVEGDVSIQAYATPRGFSSFGWHYDCEDVFIVQTAGTKEYFLRANSVNPRPRLSAMPRDMQYERETSPMIACTLVAGDWLYVPSGWWHVARALDDALSISVGVLSERAR